MNKVVMVVWGLVIFALCTLIFMIGYKKQDRVLINLTNELTSSSKQYVKDNRITTNIGESKIIYIDDLIKGNYIQDNDKIEEYCIEGVIYSRTLLTTTYTLKINCENKKTEE